MKEIAADQGVAVRKLARLTNKKELIERALKGFGPAATSNRQAAKAALEQALQKIGVAAQ
jgi:hypothetical protein